MTTQSAATPPPGLGSLIALPEWSVQEWLNAPHELRVADLRGRVVVAHAYQMLCPGCVCRGLPQARRIRESFPEKDVAVIGLQTVFEHHAAMNPDALRAFNHEYRWPFPIGIDASTDDDPVPRTMRTYELRGTPSHIVLDRDGHVRLHHFGHIEDLALGGMIGRLLVERSGAANNGPHRAEQSTNPGCDGEICAT